MSVTAGTSAAIGPGARRTTRFRLERVSLLPFVPAALLAYVQRARLRRRIRWGIAAISVLGVVLSIVVFIRREGRVEPKSLPRVSSQEFSGIQRLVPGQPATPGREASPDPTHRATEPRPRNDPAEVPEMKAPLSEARGGINDRAQQSTRKRETIPASTWWW